MAADPQIKDDVNPRSCAFKTSVAEPDREPEREPEPPKDVAAPQHGFK